jgi:hypothetical protein
MMVSLSGDTGCIGDPGWEMHFGTSKKITPPLECHEHYVFRYGDIFKHLCC